MDDMAVVDMSDQQDQQALLCWCAEERDIDQATHSNAATQSQYANGQSSMWPVPPSPEQQSNWQPADPPTIFVDLRAGQQNVQEVHHLLASIQLRALLSWNLSYSTTANSSMAGPHGPGPY